MLLLCNLKYINHHLPHYKYHYIFCTLLIFTMLRSTSSCGGGSSGIKAVNGRCPPDDNSGPTVGNR